MSEKNMEQSIRRFLSNMGYSTEPDYYGFEAKLPSILNRIFKKHLRMQNEIEQLKAENKALINESDDGVDGVV